MGRPRIVEARDTRRLILDAALELFADKGFHGTGLRDIARAVGVRESALYHHFDSKETLFEALMLERSEESSRDVRAILAKPLPPALDGLLEHLLVLTFERYATLRERKKFRLLMNDGTRFAADTGRFNFLDAAGTPSLELLELMSRLVKDKRLTGDPEFLTFEFCGAILLWRHLQVLEPTHRYVVDYRFFAKTHVAHFLRLATPEAKKSNDRSPPPRTPRPQRRRG